MGFWPFGSGKKQRVVESNEPVQEKLLQRPPSDISRYEKSNSGAEGMSRQASRKGKEDKSRRWSKSQTAAAKGSAYGQQQVASMTGADVPGGQHGSTSQIQEKALYQQNPLSQSSLGPENFTVLRQPPTLHAKRNDYDTNLPRRKSSKRKAEDYAREREVRAMSSPIPIPKRPATFYASSPLQRDTRNIPGDLNRKLRRPASEVSLPVVESFADLDDVPNQHSFKIGMLAALSPRPTVRYDSNVRTLSGKQPARSRQNIRNAIVEEDMSDKRRIDDLADDLDAGGLRELMERDRKRRERKKESDRAKLQRKLQRRAERQREEEEARRTRTEEYVRQSTNGREQAKGLESATLPRSAHDEVTIAGPSGTRSQPLGNDPFADPKLKVVPEPVPIRNPFEDDEKEVDIMQDPPEVEDDEVEAGPPVPVRSPMRRDQPTQMGSEQKSVTATLSPPVSPTPRAIDRHSLSQGSLLAREMTPDVAEGSELDRRASDQSSQKVSSWTNFFRRGTRRKGSTSFQGRSTPSEFSNTSRESFARKQPPGLIPPRSFRRSDTTTPQRTMSKFREDLPELPISPPDSRVQSPEVAMSPTASGMAPGNRSSFPSSTKGGLGPAGYTPSQSIPIAIDKNRVGQKGMTDIDNTAGAALGVPISQSLASVDSEASWLSGKPLNRLSGQGPQLIQPQRSSLNRQVSDTMGTEDDEVVDDEYFSRLSAAPEGRRPSAITAGRKASSGIIDLQREAEKEDIPGVPPISSKADETWHTGIARQPTVVRQAGRTKSKEVLLKEPKAGEVEESDTDSSNPDDQDFETPEIEAPILRAKSVEYKGHSRHLSAGSARLLDIRRSSVHSDSSKKVLDSARPGSASPLQDPASENKA